MTGPVLSGGAALVGRDAEIALLNARLDEAVAGHGGIVLLAGEPGIGRGLAPSNAPAP